MSGDANKQQTNSKKRVIGRPFKKGQSGNPKGRPKKGFAIAELIEAKVTDKDWADILAKAVEQAKLGDKAARDYLSNRRDGLPIATQKNINQDLEPLEGLDIE